MYEQQLEQFLNTESLPKTYADDAQRWFVPLLPALMELRATRQAGGDMRPILLGINGAQGTGKSTLAALLSKLLAAGNYSVANLSIDDFYLSKAARQKLASQVHPLFASRGVPGTHNVEQLQQKLLELGTAGAGQSVSLPRFDKATDDCCPESEWPSVEGPVDFIILEGWFVGLAPQPDSELAVPVNALEANEDAHGTWRQRVNAALADQFQGVFAALDYLIMLRAPSFDQVHEWRRLQEDKLRARSAPNAPGLMDEQSLARFIQHFERLTRHCLTALPQKADRVYSLTPEHRVASCAPPFPTATS